MIQILLIEDDFADAMLVQEYLSESDLEYKLTHVENIADGIATLSRAESYDILLLDLTLPDATFLQGLERISTVSDQLPIIILTGLNDKKIALDAVHKGAQDYLIKGKINTDLLERTCSYAIERKAQQNHIKRLNEMLFTIRRINEIITTEKDKKKLILAACNLFSQISDHFYSSIVLFDEKEFFCNSECSGTKDDKPKITQKQIEHIQKLFEQYSQDYIYIPYDNKKQNCPIKETLCDASLVIIKLQQSEVLYGYIILCLKQRAFSDDEISLMLEAASDISFALHSMEENLKRKEAEKNLSISEARFQTIFETAGNVILTTNCSGIVLECNPKIYNLLGYYQTEVIEKNLFDHVSPDYKIQVKAMLNTVISKNYLLEKEVKLIHKDGQIIDVNLNIALLEQEKEHQAICIIDDITEKKTREREFEFLYRNAIKLADYSTNDEIYKFIAEELYKIIPQSVIAIQSIDEDEEIVQNKVFIGLDPFKKEIDQILNSDWQQMLFPFDKKNHELDTRLKMHQGSLDNIIFGNISATQETKLEKLLNIGKIYSIVFTSGSGIIGKAIILLKKEHDIPNPSLVETFVYQASVALTRYKTYNELKKSLEDKNVLLMEIHHRIKNNMQIIISLLKIQMRKIDNTEMKELLRDSYQRIRTMALIHDKFYHTMDISYINMKDYIDSIVSQLKMFYNKKATVFIDIDDLQIDMNTAIPIGLMINEVLTNSMQHGFTESTEENKIHIEIKEHENFDVYISISDNGIGIDTSIDISKPKTVGLELIRILTLQLHGKYEIEQKNGLRYKFWLNMLV